MSRNQKYYLPLKSANLAHYFDRACLSPSSSIAKRIPDLQDRFAGRILLSNQKWTSETDCSLEVFLAESEKDFVEPISKNFALLSKPIPISRVRTVYFDNPDQRDVTLWNINSGAAFVPERIVKTIRSKKGVAKTSELDSVTKAEKQPPSYSQTLDEFNRILGGVAFMRLGVRAQDLLSEKYLSVLSKFNSCIKDDYLQADAVLDDHLPGLFSEDNKKWDDLRHRVFEIITVQDVEQYARDKKLELTKKLGVLSIENIEETSTLYVLAILASYGDGKRKSVEDLLAYLHSQADTHPKAEGLALLFGVNNGYSRLRNQYEVLGEKRAAKFMLDSRLDYYTIESVYQYVFNDARESGEFAFIDTDKSLPVAKKPPESPSGHAACKIIDKVFFRKKRPASGLQHTFIQDVMREVSACIPKTESHAKICATIEQYLSNRTESLLREVNVCSNKKSEEKAAKPKARAKANAATKSNKQRKNLTGDLPGLDCKCSEGQ